MECYCGCGRRVSRRLTDTNLRISEVGRETFFNLLVKVLPAEEA